MKKIMWLNLLLVSRIVLAQPDSITTKFTDLPDSTPVGTPDGKLVTKEIGPGGGTIISDDGKIELKFPQGALTAATIISVQPIINMVPNGNGKAYKFEPSGIRFLKPVEVTFHYTKEEAASCPPELMFMALQDQSGKWEYMDYEDWDSTTNALKGSITHFSAVVNGNLVTLQPADVEVRLGGKHEFSLNIVNPPSSTSSADGEDDLPPLPQIAPLGPEKAQWLVNNKTGGSTLYGKITPARNRSQATYIAPNAFPRVDSVTVELKTYLVIKSEKITPGRKKKGKMITYTSKKEYLASIKAIVRLFDEYAIRVVGVWDNTALGMATHRFLDTSFVTVELRHHGSRMKSVQNNLFIMEKQNCPRNCQCEYVNRATCMGPVHIAGVKAVVLEGTEQSYGTAKLFFESATADFPIIKITCPKSGGVPPLPLPKIAAIPYMVKFDLKDGEQKYEYDQSAATIAKATITVRRIKEGE